MRRIVKRLVAASALVILALVVAGFRPVQHPREIDFTYEAVLNNLPPEAKKVDIWVPYPPQTPYQEVVGVVFSAQSAQSSPEAQISYDKTYANKIVHYALVLPRDEVRIGVRYRIRRFEYSARVQPNRRNPPGAGLEVEKYLGSNTLMVVTPEIQKLADGIVQGKKTTMQKARAIYEYVFNNVSYDKSEPGWGNGDTVRVCRIKAGNCTDFHSLFISLARASGIPAKFVIGFPLPQEAQGPVSSYHCWAEFYDSRAGWVPVDISEAWKHKEKKEYYFGNLDRDRVEFSEGRDIVLEPPAHAEPRNYFIYPYAEVDGKVFENVKVAFGYQDVFGANEKHGKQEGRQ